MPGEEKRVSKIVKSISRKYNVAKYENLVINVSYEEEVEWTDLKDRQAKSKNLTKLLTMDFEQTKKDVFEELKEHNKPAHIESALDD